MVITEYNIRNLLPAPHTTAMGFPSSQSQEERGFDVTSDPASTWTSLEVVLPQLLEKAVMLLQPLFMYAWEHIKKTNFYQIFSPIDSYYEQIIMPLYHDNQMSL